MQFRFIIARTLAGLLLAGSPLWAAIPDGNPYRPIVTRNVFGLVPIPVVDPASLVVETPPPKITPNGIMTIFGKVQVLFKVAGTARAGQPPQEESYVMGEGERQDEIEVQRIDQSSATITFDNHGTIQSLPLVVGAATGGAPPAAAAPNVNALGRPQLPVPRVGGANPVLGLGSRLTRAQRAAGGAEAGANPALGGAEVNAKGIYQPAAEAPGDQLTPEQRILLLEAQREQGGPMAPLLPPTELTEGLQQLNAENQ